MQIADIFRSVQGEGFHAGMPCIFVRFAGCNLSCPWCDTDHSMKFEMTIPDLMHRISVERGDTKIKEVVLTGGEPTIQPDFRFLVHNLKIDGWDVHIETNGTTNEKLRVSTWWTVSPKTPDFIRRAGDELKLVYTGQDISEYEKDVEFKHFYLQPRSCENTEEVIQQITSRGKPWRLSVQTQKYLNIR